jgi:alpha-glucosidase
MKTLLAILPLWIISPAFGQHYALSSPDNTVKIELTLLQSPSFRVLLDNHELIGPSVIGFEADKIQQGWKVKKTTQRSVKQQLIPVVPEKSATIQDQYNELTVQFSNKLTLVFRAYDNGIAYRWEACLKDSLTVFSEKAAFGFKPDDMGWCPMEQSFYSHNERLYKHYKLSKLSIDSLESLPALVVHNNINILISESDLFDYPGMWLNGTGNGTLTAVFPYHPAAEQAQGDRNVRVTSYDNFLARTVGTRTFPWRVLMIARKDADLLTNQLVYQLARTTTEDYSWVKPGKVAWDWWNALNIEGVDFKSGINTDTYKYYVDFAARYGLAYIILDEGWSPTTDITRPVAALDMNALTAYAKEKNVGIILWVTWLALDRQMSEALDIYAAWGIKGIKVDFMQRDDQVMVNFYERTATEAAKRKLLVDFHGAYKPTGMERYYPHVITREGVYGMEQSKWDRKGDISPEHNVILPFIRNAVGPMDYTPGAMLNAQRNTWMPVFERPMSLGTRCHQLAMYVVFTSPLQMLSDAPSNYYREPVCMEFLRQVPSVWSASRVLAAKTGDYVAIARRASNGDWYVGAMTDWTARDLQLDFSFLGTENYVMDIWQDGVNANRNANDFAFQTTTVSADIKQTVHLAPGGGWVAIIRIKK